MIRMIRLSLAAAMALSFHAALAQETGTARQPAPPPANAEASTPGVRDLVSRANEAYQSQDYPAMLEAMERLHQLRPYNAEYMAFLVIAYALNEDRANAYEMMLTMQRQGLSWDFNQTDDTAFLRGTEAYDYINDLMVRAGEPVGEASIEFSLPEDVLLPTAIAWDASRESFLVTTARDGAVYRVGTDGATERLLAADEENGLWSLFGLAVDGESDRLWLTTAASPNFAGFKQEDSGRSAIVEVKLSSMEILATHPVPAEGYPHRLADVVVAGDGAVYAIDTILPIIYRFDREEGRVRSFVASADSDSFRSLAVSEDGGMLYVADYELGILALDLAGRQARRVTGPETLNFGGIEGLEFWNGHLVLIQNGNRPHRVMRLQLADDRTTVESVAPLAVAQPFFNYPNFGTLVGDKLFFFANSHWVSGDEELEAIRVASTDVESAPELVAPDVQKFWEEYYEETGQQPPTQSPPSESGR
jgi:hypothetical protein